MRFSTILSLYLINLVYMFEKILSRLCNLINYDKHGRRLLCAMTKYIELEDFMTFKRKFNSLNP